MSSKHDKIKTNVQLIVTEYVSKTGRSLEETSVFPS